MTHGELELFHKNWEYLWSKLTVTYYEVKKIPKRDSPMLDAEKLPSYSICSKINKDPTYVPSARTINKVVGFYNTYISPSVTAFQFTHEDLASSDTSRYLNPTKNDHRFVGNFWGYYPSEENIVGAFLRIYEVDNRLRAAIVTGIRDDSELNGGALRKVFEAKQPLYSDFLEYQRTRFVENKRCYFYEGDVELTRSSMVILFRTPDTTRRKLILSLNLECFTDDREKYWGGLAMTMESSDGKENVKTYLMGLSSTDANYGSLQMPEIQALLKMTTHSQIVELTSKKDRKWYEFILLKLGVKESYQKKK